MVKSFSIFICCLFFSCFSFSQEIDLTSINRLKNSAYIELGGVGGAFSLNYDRNLLIKRKLSFKGGIGVGYINNSFTLDQEFDEFVDKLGSSNITYTIRFDLIYNLGRINPELGYSFTYSFDLDYFNNLYFVHSINAGINIKLSNRFNVVPKYYLMIFDETEYDNNYIVHWSGIQLKFNF